MNFDINRLIRENIRKLEPYSSARDEFKGEARIYLDANENSLGSPLTKWYNRYPDPLQWKLKEKIAGIKSIPPENIFLGNGSDECIDLLIRAFCEPKKDDIIICPPTYGMYEVCAHINDVPVKQVRLTSNFQLDMEGLENAIGEHTKIIFLCSPNNPTANSLIREDIELLLNNFDGLVVIDEAYINFSRQRTLSMDLPDYPNLVVMQTFSKAWGLASLRLGMALASKEIIDVLNKIKPPYNINQSTQDLVLNALDNLEDVNGMIVEIVKQRDEMAHALMKIPFVQLVYPSDANFLLVKIDDAVAVYNYLKNRGIVVRNRNNVILCEGCLRITVGTEQENRELIDVLNSIKNQAV
jgi:histidinol-phosphate aminotransferase